ncbi:O-antigen polymerase [Acinetobacter terrae]|uniref:O-antigen ligase family protein n=1 Tax=Acinetobacter terrae TaxID=2731247 RepID=UPI000A3461D6|nr:O-antigen ligase family protein [Acinetobacter terrae]OTG75019.1 O-antigen polymerase [Acinetobacter terrae]
MFNLIKHFKNKELFIALYFSLFILGFSVQISPNFYNEARVLEVLLLLGLSLYSFINKENIFFKKELFFLFFISIGFFFWSNYQTIFFELLLFYFLYKLFFNLNYNKTISKLIIFSSFLVFIMFPISLWKYVNTGLYTNWYPLPWNIRIYNSYFLIFSIFAIWFYLNEIQYKNVYLTFIFFAFLSILLDGGRSVTLAYTFFIFFVCIFNNLARPKLLFTYGLTWLAYFSIIHFSSYSASGLITLDRESTSGRYELWINAFQCWIQSPIFGCGFYQLDKYSGLPAHPHNLFIQILTETGLIGFIFLSFILFGIAKNISWDFKKNYFVLAALGAIIIDLSFSGIHIYPVTQIALLWFFVFLLKNPEFSHSTYFNQLVIQNSKYIKTINLIIYVFIAVMFFYLFVNTSVLTESLPLTPPRFWEYGYQLY